MGPFRRPRRLHPSFHALPLLLAVGALGACETVAPTMSLEEAKRVTASFNFVPPPRAIGDIVPILDRQLAAERTSASYVRPQADASARPDLSAADLGRFYWSRGKAARRLGRFAQAVADLKRAAEHVKPGDQVDEQTTPWFSNLGMAIQRELAETLAVSGSHWDAIAQYERAIQYGEVERGWLFEALSGLAQLYAITGDLRGAEHALGRLHALDLESARWPASTATQRFPEVRAGLDAGILRAEATVREARGQFVEAEALWRKSLGVLRGAIDASERGVGVWRRGHLDWLKERHDADTVRLARCLLRQGLLLEAEVEGRRALTARSLRFGNFSYDIVGVVSLLGQILREQGRYAEAEILARKAATMYADGGASPVSSPPVVAPTRELAALLAAQGRWGDALAAYETVRTDLRDDRLYSRLVERDPAYLVTLVKGGRAADARRLAEAAAAQAARTHGERHAAVAELQGVVALASAALEETDRARREFEAATPGLLEGRSAGLDDEGTTRGERDARVRMILTGYIDALSAAPGSAGGQSGVDPLAEAFRLADVVRGRAVQRAVDAAAARSAARTPALADLVRREQDAGRQIAALHGLLASASEGPESAKTLADLRERIETLERARRALGRQIAVEFPAYVQLVNPPPVTLADARAALRDGEALVVTLVAEDATYVWAASREGRLAFARMPIGEKALAETVARVRGALDPRVRRLGDIPAFDVEGAHRLYRALLEPVKDGWAQAESLLVVGHGSLATLPLGVLVTEPAVLGGERAPLFANYRRVPWLARRYAITTLPSVTALVTLRRAPPASADRRPFVGFGDPYFSVEQARRAERRSPPTGVAREGPGREEPTALAHRDVVISPGAEVQESRLEMLPRLADTADEIRSIARAAGADVARDVFLGAAANEQTVKTLDLSRYRVIGFATHGLVPGDLDGLTQPALALTAPEVAKVEGDGLLTMEEILALRLDADWVVLSACNTANGAGTGAEAISGLGRAFFYAGARALLVTHWPVETTSARALTTGLFKRQAEQSGLTRAKALQQTMVDLIDDGGLLDPQTGKTVFSYAHPLFWAPFALVGDGG